MDNFGDRVDKILTVNPGTNLGQALKLSGMVLSGGEAKVVITDGLVMVNGEPETRRGRKLSSGDVIELNGARAEVAVRSRDTGPYSAC